MKNINLANFKEVLRKGIFLKYFIVGLMVLVVYYDSLYEMMKIWWGDLNYSHGFLIPIVSVFLIKSKMSKIKIVDNDGSKSWSIFIVLAFVFYLLGCKADMIFFKGISFVFLLLGGSIFFNGWEKSRPFFFPISFLIFMVPLPNLVIDRLTFPLKLLSTVYACNILQHFEVPVVRQGVMMHFSNLKLEVDDPCSGIRSIFGLIAMGALFGEFFQKTIPKKILVFVLSIPVAIFSNIMRLVLTGFIAYCYGAAIATGSLHDILGFVFFWVALLILFGIGTLLDGG